MRLMDNYVYANSFLDTVSLDALAVPDPDDGDVLTHPIVTPPPTSSNSSNWRG